MQMYSPARIFSLTKITVVQVANWTQQGGAIFFMDGQFFFPQIFETNNNLWQEGWEVGNCVGVINSNDVDKVLLNVMILFNIVSAVWSLGPGVSKHKSFCADLTDVTLSDEDANSI